MVVPNNIIDTHSHILPGIDDGVKTLMDSVKVVRWLMRQGVTDIIVTPHYIGETEYASSYDHNLELLAQLEAELKVQNIITKIYLGNEIYINEDIAALIKAGVVSTLVGGRYLLVELPLDQEFPNFEDYLQDLLDDGYKVILAHPERYFIIQKDYEIAKELIKMGILFQCNYGSFVGKYGKKTKKLANKLAKNKMIFTLGSDAHHEDQVDYITLACKKLSRYYSGCEINQLTKINPEKILTDRD